MGGGGRVHATSEAVQPQPPYLSNAQNKAKRHRALVLSKSTSKRKIKRIVFCLFNLRVNVNYVNKH